MSSRAAEGRQKPSVYLFYGDDDFSMEEAVRSLLDQYPDQSTADLNTERFTGASLNFGTLEEVLSSAPFLAERRLVILRDAGQLTSRKEDRERLLGLLPTVPPSTALVLLDFVELGRQKAHKKYKSRSALYRWVTDPDNRQMALVKAFVQPRGAGFVRWLRDRCRSLGGEIEPHAAQLLGEAVADDPHLADQELGKLLDYVDRARPIEPEDVRRLTPLYGQTDIFEMVDAVGARDGQQALAHLHRLLQDEDPRYAFAMIVRQIRLILQAREALDHQRDPAETLDQHPYVVGKVAKQARNFRLDQLEALYRQLIEIDVNTKRGRDDLATAMDRLILEFAG